VSGLLRKREYLRAAEPRSSYDVVVIGGGGHGLATAYYLASRHGITNVGVFERSYIGAGATGRNTTVLRANYKMPESVAFFKQSFDLYMELSHELDYNLLVSRRGLFWLAHSENTLRLQRERSLLNQAFGIDTVFIDPDEVQKLCPQIDLSAGGKGHPVVGASYHAPGSVIRHDAVVWGFAAAAQRLGVHVHEGADVTGITVKNGRAVGIETSVGRIAAGTVVSATAGYSSAVAALAGVRLPITSHPLQAFVTEPYKPILDRIVASADMLVYVSQTSRGEILVGAEIERYNTYSTRSTFSFLAECASRAIDLLPFTARLRILRQWTGVCDMSPDYSPLMGPTEVDGFLVTAGWGTWGFKAIPAGGMGMAELVATGTAPAKIAPFRIDRFRDDRAIPDRSSAGTH
jgi:sarcosine oxidase subunit beta